MSLFSVRGTVSGVGASTFNIFGGRFAFVEFQEESGRLVRVENVSAFADVQPAIEVGAEGEFFFDRILFSSINPTRQLYAARAGGRSIYCDKSLRDNSIGCGIVFGLPLLLVFGLGLIPISIAVCQVVKSLMMFGKRHKAFYGNDPALASQLKRQEAVRM